MDFGGFDSTIILILRGGIPRPVGNFPESLSQAILEGIILVGRLGVTHEQRYLKINEQCVDRYWDNLSRDNVSMEIGLVALPGVSSGVENAGAINILCIYIYIYTYMYIHIERDVYIYIYIYGYTHM